MRVLISGGEGFLGSWLSRELARAGHEIYAPRMELRSRETVRAALEGGAWDAVIHLAGLSNPHACLADPQAAVAINVNGTATLANEVLARCPDAHFIFPSTAHVYAASVGESITEDSPVAPLNLYAETKLRAEQELAARPALRATVLRLFNHTHHTQPPELFLGHLYKELRAAGPGREVVVPVGDLSVERDIGAVQDLVRAFAALLAKESPAPGKPRLFNLSSGQAKPLRELAEGLASRLGVRARFETDPARLRPDEPRRIVGSHARFSAVTGWRPEATSADRLLDLFLSS